LGLAAFILKSRLANTPGYNYKVEVHSLGDAQRAIRLVRSRAQEWHLDRARIGIMGFSAGGAIAALAETSVVADNPGAADPIDRESSRPNFAVLAYPGGKPTELTYTKDDPPTFIVVNNDDPLAPVSMEYATLLRKAGVPVELHVYNRGGHGFGMTGRTPGFAQLPVSGWPARFQEWMVDMGFLRGNQK
jgi:endo-1,4-beta-xylanase